MNASPLRVELNRAAHSASSFPSPWLRKSQIAKVWGPPDPRALAQVFTAGGDCLGWGLYSPDSNIPVRLISRGPKAPKEGWLSHRIEAAIHERGALGLGSDVATTGYRMVNSEGDGLPGLTIDRYGDHVVIAYGSAPMGVRREEILQALAQHTDGKVIEIWPEAHAEREWLKSIQAQAQQTEGTGAQPAYLRYTELGLTFEVPAPPAQKTGGYHDQRDNRSRLAAWAARIGGPVLDIGCHVGGFALHAANRGLEAVGFDRSRQALECAQRNAVQNNLQDRVRWIRGDMFDPLNQAELPSECAAIVLDPPKIASQAKQVKKARQTLGRVAGQLTPRLRPGGLFVLCSCSHHMGVSELDHCVAHGPGGIELKRVAVWGPGSDHPVAPGHSGGDYLRVCVYQRRNDGR